MKELAGAAEKYRICTACEALAPKMVDYILLDICQNISYFPKAVK